MARFRALIEKARSHWRMGVVLLVGLLLISSFPRQAFDNFFANSLAASEDSHSPTSELWLLSEKLGEALIIAAVLGIVVDESVKKSLVKESVHKLLHEFMGYDLPEQVKAHLKYLLHLPFVREDFKIIYTFNWLDFTTPDHKAAGCWEVTSETTYRIVNLTEKGSYYDFPSAVERTPPGLPENMLLEMETPDLHVASSELAAVETKGAYKRITKSIHVPSGKEGVRVRTKRKAHYAMEDTIVLDLLQTPCLGVTVCVHANSKIQVDVAFGTPSEKTPQPDGHNCWIHPGVHLPGSHFKVVWKKVV